MRVNPNDPRPPFLQVADDLEASIRDGRLAPGDQLPSIRELAQSYTVSPMTIQHALRLMRERSLIVSWQGRGSFVRDPQATGQATSAPTDASEDSGEPSYADLVGYIKAIRSDLARLDKRVSELEDKTQRL